ncbi:hypothetical protein GCM10020001_109390 [Nonomuraea salmonea]
MRSPALPVLVAVAAGAVVPVQSRVNAELSHRLGDAVGAAAISFTGGAIIMTVLALCLPRLRQALMSLPRVTRERRLPRRYLLAGMLGGTFTLAQSTTALITGIAVFTVSAIAGQTLGGLIVDARGVGGVLRQRPGVHRLAGAALTLVAAVVSALPGLSGAPATVLLPALLAVAAGLLLGLQQAMNGATGAAVASPLAATWVNFAVGAVFLGLAWTVKTLAFGLGGHPLPTQWWAYLGGRVRRRLHRDVRPARPQDRRAAPGYGVHRGTTAELHRPGRRPALGRPRAGSVHRRRRGPHLRGRLDRRPSQAGKKGRTTVPHDRILIKGAYLMTQDERLGDLAGDVLIADGTIQEIGPDLQDGQARVIDGSGTVVLPGFIDTHRHNWQGALRGLGPAWTYEEYRSRVQIGLGQYFEPRDVHIGNLAADLLSIDAGVTTVRDESHISNSPEHTDAAIAAHWESGIRAVFDHGWPSTEAEAWQFGSDRTHPDDIRRVRRDVLTDDTARVTLNAMLRGPELSTPEVAEHDIRLARELGLRISMHVGLGEWGAKQQAIGRLAGSGLLGSDMTFIHCCTSTDEELRMIAAHGATASVASALEVFMPGLGQPATNRLLAAGVRPSLSVDTETIVSGDMFGVMRAALAYQQLVVAGAAGPMDRAPGLPTFDAADLLSFATIEGARACGIDDRTGSLTPGKEADLIMIRIDHANLLPATDPAAAIVANGHAGNVDTVVVAGRALKEGGVLKGGETVFEQAAASRDRLFRAAGLSRSGAAG